MAARIAISKNGELLVHVHVYLGAVLQHMSCSILTIEYWEHVTSTYSL